MNRYTRTRDGVRERMLGVLASGPSSHHAVCGRMNVHYYNVLPWARMLLAGEVIVIGTVEQALAAGHREYCGDDHRRRFRRPDAKIYALPGTPKLAAVHSCPQRTTRSCGSGQIAGRRVIGGSLAGWGIWR